MKIYDISQELFHCKIYPGDPSPKQEILLRISEGAVCNLSALSLCAHNGTHIDAPFHFLEGGKTVDQLPLTSLVGFCYVFAAEGNVTQEMAETFLEHAHSVDPECARRILIKGNAVVTEDAAACFAGNGVLLVGNESQTVGPQEAPAKVHHILLGADVILLEGIRLASVPEGRYLLNAAPLNLEGADGSPCRAVLLDLEE